MTHYLHFVNPLVHQLILSPRIPAETLRRFWTMLANLQGEPLNHTSLGRSLGSPIRPSATIRTFWYDGYPWRNNTGKRLVKSPRIYLRDSGLMHSLLQISNYDSLPGHPKSGDSWEGFVLENILSAAPA